jgi:hypothetical protein
MVLRKSKSSKDYFLIIKCYFQIEQGWGYGEQINDKYRQHPNLKPYKLLDRKVDFRFLLLHYLVRMLAI